MQEDYDGKEGDDSSESNEEIVLGERNGITKQRVNVFHDALGLGIATNNTFSSVGRAART